MGYAHTVSLLSSEVVVSWKRCVRSSFFRRSWQLSSSLSISHVKRNPQWCVRIWRVSRKCQAAYPTMTALTAAPAEANHLEVVPPLSAVFTCIGALDTPSRTGPLARKYLPGFPYSCALRRLRRKISSIYCTVICNYPSAAQEQPFTAGLYCITKTVKFSWPDMHC